MGTRSITIFTGRHTQDYNSKETIRLYRHSDGSPDVMLATIATAIAVSQRILARWLTQWQAMHPNVRSVTARCLADALLAATLGMIGMSMRLDDTDGQEAIFRGPPTTESFGDQSDLEWVYVLDADACTVHVYGGYGTAKKLMKKGPTNPTAYVDGLRDQYRADVAAEIRASLDAILSAGWQVNNIPKRTGRLRLPHRENGLRQGS